MLRSTEQPYVFKESRPNRWVYHLAMWVDRHLLLPGKSHRVKSIQVNGGAKLQALSQDPNVRLIFVANHSTHSDVEILSEAQRRCGIWGAYMAAHEVFSRNKFQSWVMQRVGAFSVNRENVDRQSIKEAVKVAQGPRCSLSLFPEGNVAFTNEQVMPFMDGASFMALKAQKSLGSSVRVLVVPVSIRVTHVEDVRELLKFQLEELVDLLTQEGLDVAMDKSAPFERQIEMVGLSILQRGLKRRGHKFSDNAELWVKDPDEAIKRVVELLLVSLENEIGVKSKGGIEDRTRTLRSQLAKMRLETEPDLEKIELWDDQSILLMRVHSYAASYLRESPTLDRCSETLEKLSEDFRDAIVRPVSCRHAEVFFGEPVEVSGKNVRGLTRELEQAVQLGLSHYRSPYSGGEMMDRELGA